MQTVLAGAIPKKLISGLIDANAMPYRAVGINCVNTAIRVVRPLRRGAKCPNL